MKKILAVSGGVDSVVMLHMFRDDEAVIVAHFDHGIRPNSSEDCDFVERLAQKYGKEFICKHVNLGDCSEETAREARYNFLRQIAKDYDGRIYLAHHADDLIESVIINLLRGTGWRGIAPLADSTLERPLLQYRKKDLYRYAAENGLHFRVDQSNYDEKYLRNRVRAWLENLGDSHFLQGIYELAQKQRKIAAEIEEIESDFNILNKREIYQEADDLVALELLRAWLKKQNVSRTRPQLISALDAIRNFAPKKRLSLGSRKFLYIDRYYIAVQQG